MPLALEATPGADDANAYATVEEAEEYADYRVGGAAFLALASDEKIQALVTATSDIDTVGDGFEGERASDDQALEWPRTSTDYDTDQLPANLVKATIELAMSYAPAFASGYAGDVLNPSQSADGLVKRRKVDTLETEWFSPRSTDASSLERFPAVVQRLLAPLVVDVDAAWGSANVERGS